jgi:hypothetical protein
MFVSGVYLLPNSTGRIVQLSYLNDKTVTIDAPIFLLAVLALMAGVHHSKARYSPAIRP